MKLENFAVVRNLVVTLAGISQLFIISGNSLNAQENWHQFRGPGARGLGADGTGLPQRWSESENVAWKKPIPGRGWASPLIAGDQVVVLTAVSEGEEEAPRKGLYFGGERPEPSPHIHSWKILSLDWQSGDTLWERVLHRGRPETPIHVKNSYASETPATDGNIIVSFIADIGAFATDMDGKLLWERRIPPRKRRLDWGSASSPVIHKDRVYLQNDSEQSSTLTCVQLSTGRTLWEVSRDEPSNWSTPFVWENSDRTEIVTNGRDRVRSYDTDGNLLWEMKGLSSIAIPTPFEVDGDLIICAGYVGDRQHPSQPVLRIRPGASGDISLDDDASRNEFVRWRATRASSYNPTPLAYKGILYVLWDFGFFNARDIGTGEELYEKTRIRRDPPVGFTASPWAYDDRVFCLSEDGETFVFNAGAEYQLLHVNSLNEMCMSTPAIARGALFIRSLNHLYKIQNQPDNL